MPVQPRSKLNAELPKDELCRILSLDGGGAKGFYTLGVLKEIEGMMNCPLYKRFDLVFGTSTGAIIAALIALGYEVDEIHGLYKDHVPMYHGSAYSNRKVESTRSASTDCFRDRKFDAVKTGIGIVATKWEIEKPMIFKGNVAQAHGRVGTLLQDSAAPSLTLCRHPARHFRSLTARWSQLQQAIKSS